MKARILFGTIIIILAGIFIFCIYKAIALNVETQKSKASYENARADYNRAVIEAEQETATSGIAEDAPEEPDPYVSIVRTMQLINPDYRGWLTIPDTVIDYPVVQSSNNSYYLKHDFYKNDDKRGCPFIPWYCNTDSDNLILYGHHFRTGDMFTQLDEFRDQDFAASHKISLTTETGEHIYEVYAVFDMQVRGRPFHWDTPSFYSEEDFLDYLETAKSYSIINSNLDPQYGDKLLTLVTCEYKHGRYNGRLVVIACETVITVDPGTE